MRRQMDLGPAHKGDARILGCAEARRALGDRFEYGLDVRWRARDDAKDLAHRGLPVERLLRLVEQTHVLDGDDGLRRESLDQCDLLVTEAPDPMASDHDHSDRVVPPEHRHA